LTALRQQLIAAEMHAIFGAKNPHIQSLRVGGVTCKFDITTERISKFRNLLTQMRNFIDRVYIPDVKYIAKKYNNWKSIGGFKDKFNYMSYGGFPLDSSETNMLFPAGVILNKSATVDTLNLSQITEHVSHSWYTGSALHPSVGQTTPSFTKYDTADKYTWLKAPRYNNVAMEVGPLARVLIAYNKNVSSVKTLVDSFLQDASLTAVDLHSTLGRAAARALETKVIADAMDGWLTSLNPNGEVLTTTTIPDTGTQQGFGLTEAPRGALGHWINIQNGKISNYQMVVPSTWNLGPRDSSGNRGPVEQALIGTPVADASKPLEVLRIVHSFDPCLACAVHVIDTKKDKAYTIKVS
jgi:[NiFe] hydrogenase large subunit